MADDSDDSGDGGDERGEGHAPRECMACRGTGRVISGLGGSPSSVTCPWCEGRALRIPAIDAQARWLEQPGGESGAGARDVAAEGGIPDLPGEAPPGPAS